MRGSIDLSSVVMGLALTLVGPTAEGEPIGPEATARQLIRHLANRRAAEVVKLFTPEMARRLPVGKVNSTWDSILAQTGTFKSAGRAVVKTVAGRELVVVGCVFDKARMDIRVTVDPSGKVSGLFFGRAVAPPLPWKAPAYAKGEFDEKVIKVGTAAQPLDGKLCVPKGAGPFPAVLLVHGSGPNDMDETIGPNKPFKDLAWGLAARGVAVLRYDKRTRVYPARIDKSFTVKEEVIEDALAGTALLARSAKINPKKIFLLGHSLGGWVAPRIASLDRRIAGIVVMAGPTRAFGDVLLGQLKQFAPSKVKEAEALDRQIRDTKLAPDAVVMVLGVKTHGAYWIDYRANPPSKFAPKLRIPMLILQGGRDYQVIKADFEGWRRALKGRRNARFKLYPALNHLFMSGSGTSSPAEYMKPDQHVDEPVVTEIATWLQAH